MVSSRSSAVDQLPYSIHLFDSVFNGGVGADDVVGDCQALRIARLGRDARIRLFC